MPVGRLGLDGVFEGGDDVLDGAVFAHFVDFCVAGVNAVGYGFDVVVAVHALELLDASLRHAGL